MNLTIVIDTPPGTSDEHIALVKNFRSNSSLMERTTSILVTTPQRASLQDVAREINFCKKTGIHITGLVENMSGFVCPNCDECSNIFNAGTLIRISLIADTIYKVKCFYPMVIWEDAPHFRLYRWISILTRMKKVSAQYSLFRRWRSSGEKI